MEVGEAAVAEAVSAAARAAGTAQAVAAEQEAVLALEADPEAVAALVQVVEAVRGADLVAVPEVVVVLVLEVAQVLAPVAAEAVPVAAE